MRRALCTAVALLALTGAAFGQTFQPNGSGGGAGTPGGSNGQLQYNNSSAFGGFTMSGDCTITVPAITCTKTNGSAFAPSATTDTTNASNIASGVLAANLGGTGIANNAASTLTISGAFGTTLTVSNTTALTLPTSGTVLSSVTAPAANPVTGTPSSSTFLRGDGTWATPAGGGNVSTSGSPANGNLTKFSGASTITNGDLSGDCTTSGALAITCTKTNGVAFATSATTDTTNAANISSGTLGNARLPTIGGLGYDFLAGSLIGANFNSTADQAISLTGPASNWIVSRIIVDNCSASLTTAKGTFYAAASKTTNIVGSTSGTTTWAGITNSNAVWIYQPSGLNVADAGALFHGVYYTTASQTIYLSLTTAQGSAATCDVYVIGTRLS